jgi:hypothetical protein
LTLPPTTSTLGRGIAFSLPSILLTCSLSWKLFKPVHCARMSAATGSGAGAGAGAGALFDSR